MAGPFQSAPDVWGGGRAKGPRDPAGGPDHAPARFATQLLGAHAHAELRADGQSFRQRNTQAAQGKEGLLGCGGTGGAAYAFREVLAQPVLVGEGDTFDALLRNQVLGPCVHFLVHTASPASNERKSSRPRYKRDFTVDRGALRTVAISTRPNSS